MNKRDSLIVANVRKINSPHVRGISPEGLVLTRSDLITDDDDRARQPTHKAGVR